MESITNEIREIKENKLDGIKIQLRRMLSNSKYTKWFGIELGFQYELEGDLIEKGYLSHIDIPKSLKDKVEEGRNLTDDEEKQINEGISKHLCKSVDSINDIDRLNSIKELIFRTIETQRLSNKISDSIDEYENFVGEDLRFDYFDQIGGPIMDLVSSIIEKIKGV